MRRKKLHRPKQGSDFVGGSFSSSIETNKPFPTPVQCLVDQVQVQRPILVAATDQRPD